MDTPDYAALVAPMTWRPAAIREGKDTRMRHRWILGALAMAAAPLALGAGPADAQEAKKPNILFIMGDDIGWMQLVSYQQGLGVGETPNLDRIANEGARFMSYYAEQSCTAGRNAFFTGMNPLRTGMIPPQLPAARPTCGRARRHWPSSCTISATPPASSARTTWATIPMRCRRRMASRSSGATSIIWMQCSR